MLLIALILVAYFVGALPTAVLVGRRIAGIDIRLHGSGNPGASNVYRVLGPRWGAAVLLVDAAKGYLPVWTTRQLADYTTLTHPVWAQTEIAVLGYIALAAFAGHVFSPFLGFRGGKGAATGLGAMFALSPQASTIGIVVYGIVLYISRTFSLATLAAALAFPPLLWWREGSGDIQVLLWGLAVPALLVLTHRQNVLRLLRGQELHMQDDEEHPSEEAKPGAGAAKPTDTDHTRS